MNLKQLLGLRGESRAARYLRKHKQHKILARNYKCEEGEIDLITLEGDRVVFVEVKTRRSDELERPFNAVDRRKQRKLSQIARYFLMTKNAQHVPARFDVVSIVWPEHGKPIIEHFENAFPIRI